MLFQYQPKKNPYQRISLGGKILKPGVVDLPDNYFDFEYFVLTALIESGELIKIQPEPEPQPEPVAKKSTKSKEPIKSEGKE